MLTEEKFTHLVKTYMDMVYRIALNYLREPGAAEDVCQEVFFRLLKSRITPEDEAHLKHWLVRVTLNESKRALSLNWRRLETPEAEVHNHKSADGEGKDMLQLVMSLPANYRIVLYLYYYEGYSTKEIAGLLHCPAATVRSRLDRGRKQLKQSFLEAEDV